MHQARKKQRSTVWNSPNIKITKNDWKFFKCCSPVHAWVHVGLGVTCNNMYFKALFIEPQWIQCSKSYNTYTEGEKQRFAGLPPFFWSPTLVFAHAETCSVTEPFQHRSKGDLTLRSYGKIQTGNTKSPQGGLARTLGTAMAWTRV